MHACATLLTLALHCLTTAPLSLRCPSSPCPNWTCMASRAWARLALPLGVALAGPTRGIARLESNNDHGGGNHATSDAKPQHKRFVIGEERPLHPCAAEGRFVPGCSEIKIFSGRSHRALAEEVAALLGLKVADATVDNFADGETQIRVLENTRGKDCYVIQSSIPPVNERVIELLLFVATLRRASAKAVTAIIPYYGVERLAACQLLDECRDVFLVVNLYSVARYKHHYRPGPVEGDKKSRWLGTNSQDIAKMLEVMGVDRIISVDIQRPGNPQEGVFFDVPVEMAMSDTLAVAHFANDPILRTEKVTVVAPNPDVVRKAWMVMHGLMDSHTDPSRVHLALFNRAPVVHGTRIHRESELLGDVEDAHVILVDDLIDTANTLLRASQLCKEGGAKNIRIYACHGLFTSQALDKIEACPHIERVVVTNTIPLPPGYKGKKVVQLSVAPILAKLIQQDHYRRHQWNEEQLVQDPEESRAAFLLAGAASVIAESPDGQTGNGNEPTQP